jgi:hypothetical protein
MRNDPRKHSKNSLGAPLVGVLALVFFLIWAGIASAAVVPQAALRPVDLDQLATWTAPRVDLDRLLAEDRARRHDPDAPHRTGVEIITDLSPANSGSWHREAGRLVWQLVLRSEGALWLLPQFDRVRLGPGTEISMVDIDGRTRLGPYTRDDVTEGRLTLPPIDGDTVVIRVDQPQEAPPSGLDLHLGRVYHGYRSWNGGGPVESGCSDPSGACNIDVNCPLGADWQDEKRGIVQLNIPADGLTASCTGTLINNTNLDCAPYILTAEHCFSSLVNPNLAALTVLFNFERPGCGPGSAYSAQSVTGVTLVSRHPEPDFRLLRIIDPLPDYELYFNGWSRLTPSPAAAHHTIHHPTEAPMKISRTGVALAPSTTYDSHWRVVAWSHGTTEGASSGAPLFDPLGRIIGQLRGGSAACVGSNPGPGSDHFGRFDVSWDIHPTLSVLRLKDWLDPGDTDTMALAGMDQSFCGDPRPKLEHAAHEVSEIQVDQDGDLDPGDIAELSVFLANVGPVAAATEGVVGTLSAPGESDVTVLVADADWPGVGPGRTAPSAEPHFAIDVDPDRLCGQSIRFEITVESEVSSFLVGTGTPIAYLRPFEDDMESGPGPWTPVDLGGVPNPWAHTTGTGAPGGGTSSWFVTDVPGSSDSALTMPPFSNWGALAALERYDGLPPGLVLRFDQDFNSECGPDGGVLEYSLDGVDWVDAGPWITEGGYNATILPSGGSALAGRDGWSGDLGGWHSVEVDFSEFEGTPDLHLRWRFATDNVLGIPPGWYVDNVVMEAPDLACPPPPRRDVPGAYCRGHWGGDVWPPPLCTSRPRDDFGRR